MAGEFQCRPEVLQGIAQSLLEMRKMARSIEQSAEALVPLASAPIAAALETTVEQCQSVSNRMGTIYRAIAKEAMA